MYTHCILRPHATVSQRVHECDKLICREQSRAIAAWWEEARIVRHGLGKG